MSQLQALASSSKDVMEEGREHLFQPENHREDDDASTPQDVEDDGDSCLICLGDIIDQSVLPTCMHSLFCFDCIIKWISIHRRCPLCSSSIEDYIIHSIKSDNDYIRHYLPKIGTTENYQNSTIDPLRLQADLSQTEARRIRRQLQQRIRPNSHTPGFVRDRASSSKPDWGEVRVEERQRDAIAQWDQRLAFRRRIYREELYCLHMGSNSTSRLTPPSSHSTISSSPLIESTLLSFIRRELMAYPSTVDVDFLSRYTIHIFKSFDCKSNEAIDLIEEFLGSSGASHFCHEVFTFSRFIGQASARQRDKVKAFDEWAQYRPVNLKKAVDRKRDSIREQGKVSTLVEDSNLQTESMSDTRQLVIRDREKLLQRLEKEKDRHKKSSDIEALDESGDTSLKREKALKEKLLLQRKQSTLRIHAIERRAKRIKM